MLHWFERARQELDQQIQATRTAIDQLHQQLPATAASEIVEVVDRLRRAGNKLHTELTAIPDTAVRQPGDWPRWRHELLNPPNQIINYCEYLFEDLVEPSQSSLGVAIDAVGRAARALPRAIFALFPRDTHETDATALGWRDPPTPISQDPDRLRGKLLVVDDQELARDSLARWLVAQGHQVETAQDGTTALDQVSRGEFDLILLDVVMPGLSGEEVLGQLKRDPSSHHVPVIMISAVDELDRVVRCIEIGAEDYLPKPFERVLLEARIGACLEKKQFRDRERVYLRQLEFEKERYNNLLHQILPAPIVAELTRTGQVSARRYEQVAVLFADVVGFTTFCNEHPPEEVVQHLQMLVRAFEEVAARVGVQKIKTSGDSFMAAAGLLEPVANPVQACVECGLEMFEVAKQTPPYWELRIGIHVGSVVAGVLGNRHDLFDLWGDTVNTAARLEQSGMPSRITLSRLAWQTIEHQAHGIPLGEVDLKGKGPVEIVCFHSFHQDEQKGEALSPRQLGQEGSA